MSRKIKFKGYHKTSKQWVYGDLIQPTRGNVKAVILVSAGCNGGWLMPLQRYAIDPKSIGQFTGLKDKNGTEIYEGDVFECHYKDETVTHHKWQIVWNKEGACFSLKRIGANSCNQSGVSQSVSDYSGWRGEVIGNIYENKDLL